MDDYLTCLVTGKLMPIVKRHFDKLLYPDGSLSKTGIPPIEKTVDENKSGEKKTLFLNLDLQKLPKRADDLRKLVRKLHEQHVKDQSEIKRLNDFQSQLSADLFHANHFLVFSEKELKETVDKKNSRIEDLEMELKVLVEIQKKVRHEFPELALKLLAQQARIDDFERVVLLKNRKIKILEDSLSLKLDNHSATIYGLLEDYKNKKLKFDEILDDLEKKKDLEIQNLRQKIENLEEKLVKEKKERADVQAEFKSQNLHLFSENEFVKMLHLLLANVIKQHQIEVEKMKAQGWNPDPVDYFASSELVPSSSEVLAQMKHQK